MAMNMDAVLRIAAKVTGLQDLDGLGKRLKGAESAAQAAGTGFKAMVNSAAWQSLAVGAAGIGVALGTSVKAAIDFESAMADVRKVVPGLESAAGLREMRQEIIGLSKELPVSAEGLAAITAAAGQAGIAKEELADFTRTAAQMGVAFDISAAEAGESMAKLRTSLGLTQPQVVGLADAMNHLSNNMASSAAQVNEFMLRAGAVGKQVALTTEQTAAFGSAMIAAGAAPEVAGTSFMNLIRALTKGESATERQAAALQRLGLEATQVAKDMQVNAVGTIRDVFTRISRMPAEMRVATVSEVFGDEARALTPLITNMKLFEQAMSLVGSSSEYAGSMLNEFQARAGTSANNFQLLQNNIKALQIAIGDGLLPAINLVFKILMPVLSVVADLAGRFPLLTAGVVALSAGLAAIVLLAPGILAVVTLLGQLGVTAAGVGAIWAGLQTVFIVAFKGILSWLGSTFIPAILTFFSGPVGWTVLAIAAVVAMAIAFREPIGKFLVWLWDEFKKAMVALGNAMHDWIVKPLENLWNDAGELTKRSLGDMVRGVQDWWRDIQGIWGKVTQFFNTYVIRPVQQGWDSMVQALPRAMTAAVNLVRDAWRSVLQYIANQINTVAGLINRLISSYNALPAPDILLIPTITVPAFAEGGYVRRPTLAMVGEGSQPEYIIPESKMAAASANYLAGSRGADVIPTATPSRSGTGAAPIINIRTGKVVEFDGQRYVSMQDFERGLRQVSEGVIGRLRTPAARAALGMR